MNSEPDFDSVDTNSYSAEIKQIETDFLDNATRFTKTELPYLDLVTFCINTILYRRVVQFLDEDTYRLIQEIAILARETDTTTDKIKAFVEQSGNVY